MSAGALLAGYGADLAFGDPSRLHPVAGFGRTAAALERMAYAPSRLRGAAITAGLVLGATGVARVLALIAPGPALAALTWTTLGGRTLRREALAVAALIERGELGAARERLRSLCGRDAAQLDAAGLRRAVVESLAENTADAVVGALLWGAVAGPAGASAYRAINTLDAMFGHRSARYASFGWAPARLDDLVNWPVARASALLAAALAPLVGGSARAALSTWARDAGAHPSPNAGVIESAFAGALGLRLGGPLAYGGRTEPRPVLGSGHDPGAADVRRAVRLSAAVGAAAAGLSAALRSRSPR